MLASLLLATSALVIFALGAAHLVITFHGTRLHPRDDLLLTAMQAVRPKITRETTMWKCWIGINASHSLGAMLFGLTYGYLALCEPTLLFGAPFLLGVGLAMLIGLAVLGRRYWFSVPFRGIAFALLLYVASIVVAYSS